MMPSTFAGTYADGGPDHMAATARNGMVDLIGVVMIGRNEGERLVLGLRSIPSDLPIVYVDSGSSDGSAAFARSIGAEVVNLDMQQPFTAARARNEGAARLLEMEPGIAMIQFLDGDCEMEQGWLAAAAEFLAQKPSVAAVCGRRRERYPDASFYNRLCDEEWNTPVGKADACGGDALYRVEAWRAVGGFDPNMIAGEEPELCQRLRSHGWTIWRLGEPMTIHDADMHHWRQWWMRAVRSGFGYAQVMHKSGQHLYAREVTSALFWTLGVVLVALLASALIGLWGLLMAPLIWSTQMVRLTVRKGGRRAFHLLLGKIPETIGVLRYGSKALRGGTQGAIFYK